MSLQKFTYVDQIEINCNGDVGVRLVFTIEDEGKELNRRFHRTVVPIGTSPAAQMAAVAEHIGQMGEAPLLADDSSRLISICAAVVVNTPKGGKGQRGRSAEKRGPIV